MTGGHEQLTKQISESKNIFHETEMKLPENEIKIESLKNGQPIIEKPDIYFIERTPRLSLFEQNKHNSSEKARTISFEGTRDTKAFKDYWHDGITCSSELSSEVFKSAADDFCKEFRLPKIKMNDTTNGTGVLRYNLPFSKYFSVLLIDAQQEYIDANTYGKESPIFTLGHEMGHYAEHCLGKIDKSTRLMQEMYADAVGVLYGALNGFDLRDEVIALRTDEAKLYLNKYGETNKNYPDGEMTVVNANLAYDFSKQYEGIELTPQERKNILITLHSYLNMQAKGVTVDNYVSSDWYKNYNDINKITLINIHNENLPEIFRNAGFGINTI